LLTLRLLTFVFVSTFTAVFKSAASLADYRKRLTKRLKKLQKSYVPNQTPDSSKEVTLQQLRYKYGDDIRYILQHAAIAIASMRYKHGEEKSSQLKQHTDGVKLWASDLGLLDSNNGKPNVSMSDEQLDRLKGHLERRMENIKAHVVKLADPDQFILDSMEKVEMMDGSKQASLKLMAATTRKRYEQLQSVDSREIFSKSLELTQLVVPPPTRNERKNDQQAALIHLEKMRAAATLLVAWTMVEKKSRLGGHNVMAKAHTVAKDGAAFVAAVMNEHRKTVGEPGVTLEDAWMKPLVLPTILSTIGDELLEPSEKRVKTANQPFVVKSRVLLTSGRKAPINLLPALKRKRATLVRPEPNGHGAHLVLEFGRAFVMTIFFVPLVVTLRAFSKDDAGLLQKGAFEGASFMPLEHGLSEREVLTVWGVQGEQSDLGHVVQERLRDASCHATHVLRKCFEKAQSNANTTDFEMEIREATALLEFIQLTRTTFIADWADDYS
jgi:hypothetical protein